MERYCRLCTETKKDLSSVSLHKLYCSENEAAVSLANIIENYLTICMSATNSEALICFECLKTLEEWHLFREKCLENERQHQKQVIHFEVVITSDVAYSNTDESNENVSRHPKFSAKACNDECGEAEENVDYFSDSPSAGKDTHTSEKSALVSRKGSKAVLNYTSQSAIKYKRRLKTRCSAGEKQNGLVSRKKRGRPKLNDIKSKEQKSTPPKGTDGKQRVVPKICTICGVARTDMAAHMRWHNDERPYKCSHCPKVFVNCSNLRNHVNLHTREKLYKCDLCDKEFPSSTARSKHREIHATVNAYLCAICGKSFKYRASLARHKLIHSIEPKVKCTVCDMIFLTKTRLTKHLLIHTNMKPFTCDVCNRSFNRKDNLKTHMKTHVKTIKTEAIGGTNKLVSATCKQTTN